MQPLTYFLPQARDHVRSLWSLDGTRMASQAIKWLYSEEGAAAYVFWVSQMLDSMTAKEEWRSDLATQIFRFQAESLRVGKVGAPSWSLPAETSTSGTTREWSTMRSAEFPHIPQRISG